MTFELFGFELNFYDREFGFWFFDFKGIDMLERSLFLIYYSRFSGLYFDLFWFNIIRGIR